MYIPGLETKRLRLREPRQADYETYAATMADAETVRYLRGTPLVRDIAAIYTTIVRAVPELVLILLLYYAGTDMINRVLESLGYQRVAISGLVAGIVVLGFVQGAYATEVLRGAIKAIPQGKSRRRGPMACRRR